MALETNSYAQSTATASTEQSKAPQATKAVTLSINGRSYTFTAQARETLVNVLRDRIGLTGTKRPCNRSECGGCTVVIDGRAVLSCSALAVELEGSQITTIEGLMKNGTPHPVQQAFAENMGYQCGYCTSGEIMSAYALLTANANPTDAQIMDAMSANLCKCSAYPSILKSVKAAAQLMNGGTGGTSTSGGA
ncbi:MAG: (2Fe-2S)-binding protein [Nitrososphaerota archaeon]|nr:(2Fe-2S)-binding protein [Nitrososphaerota archaeon]